MLSALVLLLLSPAGSPLATQPVAIVGATVIDVEDGRRIPNAVVVVRDNVIESVRPGGRVPRGARRVDGHNRYLIPGLWDMHVHTLPQPSRPRALTTFLPLFVANGVTGVRDMGSEPGAVPKARERIAREGLVAPRLIAAGPILDGPAPQWPAISIAVGGADDAPRAVEAAVASGADFLKVYSDLPRDAYRALAAAAAQRRLPLAGHVPFSVSVADAVDSGQRSIEHLVDIQIGCSSDDEDIRRDLAAADAAPDATAASRAAARRAGRARAGRTFDPSRCRDLLDRLARARTWVVPTLSVLHNSFDAARPTDPRLRYFEAETRATWSRDTRRPGTPVAPLQGLRDAGSLDTVRRLSEAGVPLLAGTDLTNFYTMPGFDLHLELALLVEAGLTPLQSLRAATLEPARFLGREDELGTVAAGKRADLVLLDADPLLDIRNTRKIAAVLLDGRLFDREDLDALLAATERAAAAPVTVP